MKNIIRQHRVKLNLTQQALADKIGVSANTIRAWEAHISNPKLSQLSKLTSTLEITTNELLEHWEE